LQLSRAGAQKVNDMDQNIKQSAQEDKNKNQVQQNTAPKKEETIQAGKDRMGTDGNTHVKVDADKTVSDNLKKDKPAYQSPLKRQDLPAGQVNHH
jgi:hypothetical protein